MSELAEKLDALIESATPGPWMAANMVHAERGDRMTPEELGEYVANNVKRSRNEGGSDDFLFVTTAEDDVPDICHVGNGPVGPYNARMIALAPLLAAVAREVPDLIDMAASYLNICPDRHGHSVETLNRARASLAALAKEIDNG